MHKLLLALGVVFLLVGGVLFALSGSEPHPVNVDSSPFATSLTAGGAPTTPAPNSDPLRPWSQFFLKGGGGFLLGFCIGYATRSFLKVSSLFVGIVLLAMFALHSAGIIEIDFLRLEGFFDRIWLWLQEQFSAGRTFLEGNLPSGAAASTGAFVGFKRG